MQKMPRGWSPGHLFLFIFKLICTEAIMTKHLAVPKKHIVSNITNRVRRLKRQDFGPQVRLQRGKRPELVIVRDGNADSFPISVRVAEELIAAGFDSGN